MSAKKDNQYLLNLKQDIEVCKQQVEIKNKEIDILKLENKDFKENPAAYSSIT